MPDGEPPTPDLGYLTTPAGLAKARAAVRIIGKHFDDFEVDPATVQTSRINIFAVAWGWSARSVRTALLIVEACEAGYAAEAVPLVRSLMEHTLSLQWLLETGEPALLALAAQRHRHQSRIWDNIDIAGWPPPPGLTRPQEPAPAAAADAVALLGNFAAMLDHYGLVRLPYMLESQTLHASYDSALGYCGTGPKGGFEPLKRVDIGEESATVTAAQSAMWVLLALNRELGETRLTAAIEEATEALGVRFALPSRRSRSPVSRTGADARQVALHARLVFEETAEDNGVLAMLAEDPDAVRDRVGDRVFSTSVRDLQSAADRTDRARTALAAP